VERQKRRGAIDGVFLACLLGVAAPTSAHSSDPPFWPGDVTSRIGGAAEQAGTSALVAVHRGEVVLEWGAIARRFDGQSLRKSLLSALIGIAVDRGLLDIGLPVGSFELPEGGKLNEVERRATVRELMMARSGIYLRAAHETPATMWKRPRRNAYAPGEHWYYNNWDFNALGVIFEQSAGLGIGVAFHRWIAVPLGMRDFRPEDVRYERWLGSRHPAYPIRVSARDLAAFGLLFAQEGRWGDGQVISRAWVHESTRPYSDTGDAGGGAGYGLMWWVEQDGRLIVPGLAFPSGSFMGFGWGGQYLVVLPACRLVVANLVDTGTSDFARFRWLVFGDPVEPEELASILRPMFHQAGCVEPLGFAPRPAAADWTSRLPVRASEVDSKGVVAQILVVAPIERSPQAKVRLSGSVGALPVDLHALPSPKRTVCSTGERRWFLAGAHPARTHRRPEALYGAPSREPVWVRSRSGFACITLSGDPQRGEVAEWSKAAVLKTARAHALVGSNPTLSAIRRPGARSGQSVYRNDGDLRGREALWRRSTALAA
jgi:CubicO group peptidase (beta-lactamase class C family)